jgi:uncharacterized membrane protein
MRLSRIALAFFGIGFLGQLLYYYPNLPEKMASHYNASGEPDNWMSKQSFLILELVILLVILAEFTLLPFLLERIPNSLINMPHKSYWLADERRHETFSVIRHYLEWFSVGLLGLFIAINEMVFRANLNNQRLSNAAWIALIIFLIFVAVWLTKFILRFRLPK